MRPRRTRPLWLAGVLTAPLLAAGAPAAHAGPATCFGEPATIEVRHAESDVVGTPGPDVMVVTGRFVRVFGLDGGDRICTNGHIVGGPGHDRLLGFRRTDVVRELTLSGGPGDDRIYRQGPRDGDPHLVPVMRGGAGDDRLTGGNNLDRLLGGRGQDRLLGDGLRDTLRGGRGADSLLGEADRDVLFGGPEDDRLRGGTGRDFAGGGAGLDRAWGGPGRDACDAEVRVSC
ncbi:calcium-binding protein [Nocardioides sp. GXQ0305]|uniref:calcium-binding protein n=1 Tax=Nocardioides sp. GXQ0305 TaxID=3423912 RepID=UPI003D7E5828